MSVRIPMRNPIDVRVGRHSAGGMYPFPYVARKSVLTSVSRDLLSRHGKAWPSSDNHKSLPVSRSRGVQVNDQLQTAETGPAHRGSNVSLDFLDVSSLQTTRDDACVDPLRAPPTDSNPGRADKGSFHNASVEPQPASSSIAESQKHFPEQNPCQESAQDQVRNDRVVLWAGEQEGRMINGDNSNDLMRQGASYNPVWPSGVDNYNFSLGDLDLPSHLPPSDFQGEHTMPSLVSNISQDERSEEIPLADPAGTSGTSGKQPNEDDYNFSRFASGLPSLQPSLPEASTDNSLLIDDHVPHRPWWRISSSEYYDILQKVQSF
ncbi:uncharacterized protein Z520_10248 [Fonsecaea multimorphosa CBS 102226]|uniref:Uncharacterized protein n=1 Tax=Fonsecaea multimorphosa CBS 102226 TaxID=1442371 RepID=A0A0D2I9T6_9EURO|nr:uncharacterized protein Z520_10248 [Fonsecaea multimorphosa CBS 102226]KIX93911.1 hypothetical protein Z520_10248 [Fonsecaea multimorphosa CBS 102226]